MRGMVAARSMLVRRFLGALLSTTAAAVAADTDVVLLRGMEAARLMLARRCLGLPLSTPRLAPPTPADDCDALRLREAAPVTEYRLARDVLPIAAQAPDARAASRGLSRDAVSSTLGAGREDVDALLARRLELLGGGLERRRSSTAAEAEEGVTIRPFLDCSGRYRRRCD